MTQITIFSIVASYLGVLVVVGFAGAAYLRRRRITKFELAYVRQHPPMPYTIYRRRAEETQEVRVVRPTHTELSPLLVRHINPSQQVSIEIHPDADLKPSASIETNLHKLYAHLEDTQASR